MRFLRIEDVNFTAANIGRVGDLREPEWSQGCGRASVKRKGENVPKGVSHVEHRVCQSFSSSFQSLMVIS